MKYFFEVNQSISIKPCQFIRKSKRRSAKLKKKLMMRTVGSRVIFFFRKNQVFLHPVLIHPENRSKNIFWK
jgi:hypothetical protein